MSQNAVPQPAGPPSNDTGPKSNPPPRSSYRPAPMGHPEYRVLVVDDTPAIHKNYQTILAPRRPDPTAELEAAIFGEPKDKPAKPSAPLIHFVVDSAHQGKQALEMVEASLRSGSHYAMAFVDMRMPPGWDGIETITRIWAIYPELEVVIATAYSDHSLDEIIDKLVHRDRFLVLKKPFDPMVVLQMAYSLTEKWQLRRSLLARMGEVQKTLIERAQKIDAAIDSSIGGSSSSTADLMEHLRTTRKTLKEVTNNMRELTNKFNVERER